MKNIAFVKMVASGNDFVVIDSNQKPVTSNQIKKLAMAICDRHYGVGADGLLLIEKSNKADFRMRIINADGSEAEMCGNGARCVALYAYKNKIAGRDMRFETIAGMIDASVSRDSVKLGMSDPKDLKLDINLSLSDGGYTVNFINTGVPHAVAFVDNIENQSVRGIGKEIRYHSAFTPKGTNADFVKAEGRNVLRVRTYERGVEDETLACGTGAVASALISAIVMGYKSPVTCITRSGDRLKVYFRKSGNDFKDVYLEGGACVVFEGIFAYK